MSTQKLDTYTQAGNAKKKFDEDLEKLWKVLVTATPEQQEAMIQRLDAKTIHLLRTRSNPFKKPVYKGENRSILAFNLINLREKYYSRFCMTGLIGFLYRMLDEWTPEGMVDGVNVDSLISQQDSVFSNMLTEQLKVFEYETPLNRLEAKFNDPQTSFADQQTAKIEYYQRKLLNLKPQIESANLTLDTCKLNLDRANKSHKMNEKRLMVLKNKLALRQKFENSVEQIKLLERIKNRPIEYAPRYEDIPDELLEDIKNTRLSDFDKEQSLDVFHQQIINRENYINMDLVSIQEHTDKTNDAQIIHNKLEAEFKDLQAQIKKIKDICRQNNIKKPVYSTDKYEATEDEYSNLLELVKRELNITDTREEFIDRKRNLIQLFLDQYFLYNPDIHVQCAYKPNYNPKLRNEVTKIYQDYQACKINKAEYDRRLAEYNTKITELQEKYEYRVIPPDDTFARLDRYIENHYEELRQATDDIYCEKSDFEFSIVPLKVFTGNNDEQIQAEAHDWKQKYSEEFESDVYQAEFGIHNLLGSWIENREKRDFYTKNSEIIKGIIKANEDDKRLGKKLMKQRTENMNKKSGPVDPGIKNYMKSASAPLTKLGAKHISDITDTELKKINRTDDSTKNEVEVGYYSIQPRARTGKRRYAGQTNTGKFHIPADNESSNTGLIMKPSDVHKSIAQHELKEFING